MTPPDLGAPPSRADFPLRGHAQNTLGLHEGRRIISATGVLGADETSGYAVTYNACLEADALFFEAVDGEAWVYWNGRLLGHHKGWDKPFTIDTDPADVRTEAANCLAVRVHDGAHQGGIYRPAYLIRAR